LIFNPTDFKSSKFMISLFKTIRILLLVSFAGCAVVSPFVQDFNIVPIQQEVQIGQEAAKQIAKEMKLVEDARTENVRKMGARLVSALPRKDYAYQFYVVEDPSPNAFTIPGGTIYVHTGLIKFAEDSDALAGVMAHEIGHAFERHPAKAMSRQYGVQRLSSLIFKGDKAGLQNVAFQLAGNAVLLRYSRDDEFQADEVGYLILKRAGYKTDGLLRFFSKLQTLERGGFSIPFLSTHPPTPERIARLKAFENGQLIPQVTLEGEPVAVPRSGLVSQAAAPQYATRNYSSQNRRYRRSGAQT
jgi:predicted Zn-dependent protease